MTQPIILAALAALAACLAASPALARPAPATTIAAKDDLVRVRIETSVGAIVVALDRGHAPLTVANFLAYVDARKLDGEAFYRAMPYGAGGLIQGGVMTDARKLLAPVAHEPSSATGLKNVAGAIVMARLEPGSARSDFFILTSDIPAFDADAKDPGFAVFGRVTEGMAVVKAILAAPVSPTKGAGAMKGQMLDPPVKIVTAARIAP